MKECIKKSILQRFRGAMLFAMLSLVMGWNVAITAQTPTVTARFLNPVFDCDIYCVDVEFIADTIGYQFEAMNIRFFYPDDLLEFYNFMQIEENYFAGDVTVETSLNAGPALFNFSGGADFVNGSIFVNDPEMAVFLDTAIWTSLFQVCFTIDDANSNMESFCPSIVWDLQQDPSNGGFLPGDDGVVIILIDPDDNSESIPCLENVVQFNWEYIGEGSAPFGEPVEDSCIIFDCPLTILCAVDTTVDCHSSLDPSSTGYTNSSDFCPGDSTIVYTDSIATGDCINDYTIYRTWVATNLCGNADTCQQIITVIDTSGPVMTCPANITVDCTDDVPLFNLADVMAIDNCPGSVTITFEGEAISNQSCTDRFDINRTFSATDECGNVSTCVQTISVFDEAGPLVFCPPNITVQCAGLIPVPDIGTVSSSDVCGGSTTEAFVSDVISNQTCAHNYILTRTYSATDECGNSSTCTQVISVVDNVAPTISTCPITRNLEGCTAADITDPPYATVSTASSEAVFENATNFGDASDLCGIASVSYIDVSAGPCPITVTRTWTVSDACGQTATCNQTIYVEDFTLPIIESCAISRVIGDCDLSSITEPIYSDIPAASSEAEFENGTNQGVVSDDCAITDVTYVDVAVGSCPIVVTRTWTLSDACGNSATCNQTISICLDPSDADAGPDQEFCNLVSTTLAGNTPVIGTGTWSVISGTASITDPSSPTSEVTDLVPGTSVILEWIISNGSCAETADQMTITIVQLPTTADAGFNRLTCDTLTNAIGNTPLVGTGLWTVVSGTATLVSPSSPTTVVTGLVHSEVTTLQWTITNGSCPPSTDQMTISVLTYPDAGPDQVLCSDINSTSLAANPVTVGLGAWYVASGMATIDDYYSPTTSVTLTPGVATTLVWQVWFPPEGCNINDTMMITWVDSPDMADAGMDQTLCNLTTTTLDANEPLVGVGQWSVISGVATITDPAAYNSGVTGLVPGTSVVLQWTITNGDCMQEEDQMMITSYALPTTADAGSDQYLCEGETTTTLDGNVPLTGTGMWQVIDGVAIVTNPDSPTSGVTGMVSGTLIVIQWTITNSEFCPSSVDEMIIYFDDPPSMSDAGPDQELCNVTTTTLAANIPGTGTGMWNLEDGAATITDPTSPTSGVTGLVPGSTALLSWVISNGECPDSYDEMEIIVNLPSTIADAGDDQLLCSETTTILSGNTPIDGDGLWTVISGTATIDDPSSPSSGVSDLMSGTSVTLEWTIINGNCPESTDQMTITIGEMATTADAGPLQFLCEQYTTTLQGNTPISGTGIWTVISGVATISNPLSPTSEVTGLDLPYSEALLKWTITNGTCISEDSTYIFVESFPTANAGMDQQLCNVDSTLVSADPFDCSPRDEGCQTGYWTVTDACGGTNTSVTFTEPDFPITEVHGLEPGCSYTLVWTLISENGNCSASDEIIITVSELPSTSDAGPDQQFCNLSTATLAANSPIIGVGLWSVVSGTATITTPGSPTSGVTGLVAGTSVTLQWTITNGFCPPSTDQMTITVDESATQSNAGPDQQLCDVSTTTLAGNTPLTGTGVWELVEGIAMITDPTSPTSEVTDLAPAFSYAVLLWTITNGSCVSESYVSIIVENNPIVDAGPDQYLCNTTTATLNANEPFCYGKEGCEDGEWTLINGTATITDPTFHMSGVTGLVPGTSATFQWTVTNPGGNCSANDQITIYVDELPTDANAGPDQELCNQTTTTLAGNTPIVGTGLWSVISGTANITTPDSPTSGVTGLISGTTVILQWTITNGVCPASTDQMTIINYALPTIANAGPDQELCNQTFATLDANTPVVGSGLWTVISGTATITTPDSPISGVTGLIVGASVTLQWTITNGVCPSSLDQITITVFALPTIANAGPDQQICNQTTTTLAGNAPIVGTGLWSVISGTANITTPDSPMSGVTGLVPGTSVTLEWTITNGVCTASVDQMTIVIDELPTTANAGPDQQLCNQTTTTLAGNTTVVGTGLWSVVSGTATITTPSSPTSGVTGLIIGTTVTLQWSITNGVCPASTDQMTITVFALPTTANAGPDQQICNQTTTTLAGNAPVVGTGLWSVINGTANITTPGSPTSEVTGLIPGTSVTLQWTITNGVCTASVDQMTIVIDELPTTANAGPDQQLCNQTTTTLAGNTPVVGTGLWSVVSGTATITTPSSPTSGVTGLIIGSTVTLQWSITNGVCPASTDQMTITVFALPTTANAGPDQEICNQTTTTLAGNAPVVGTGLWSVINGTANITTPGSPTSSVTGLIPGTSVTLQWTITNGVCPASTDQMTIINYALPTEADAGFDQQICNQTNTIVFGNNPLVGTGLWSVFNGTANITNPSSPVTPITGLIPGTTVTLQWTITNGVCPSSMDQVMITSYALPTMANAGPDQQFCNLTTATLAGNTPIHGTGLWTVFSGIATIANPTSPTSVVTGLVPGSLVILRWTITNGTCPPSSDLMKIKIDALPGPVDAGPDQFLCDRSFTTLEAEDPLIGNGSWTVISGMATIFPINHPHAAVTNLALEATAILQWSVTNGTCPAITDEISITVSDAPTPSDAGPDQLVCQSTSTSLQGNTPLVGVGFWLKISGPGDITHPDSPTSPITGLQANQTTIAQWTIWNGYCQPSVDEVTIEVTNVAVVADAGEDQLICGENSVTLEGNDPQSGSGMWTIIEGTGTIIDPTDPTTEVVDLVAGETLVLQWRIMTGDCVPTSDQVSIFTALSGFANAGVDQSLCVTTSTTVEANIPILGTGKWTVISGNAEVIPDDQPIAQVINLEPGTSVVLQWTVFNGDCPPDSDQITIQIGVEPSVALAGTDIILCNEDSTSLAASGALVGIGSWSVISGVAIIADPSSPSSMVTGLLLGTTAILEWNIESVGCPSSKDTMSIQVDASPSISAAGPDQIFCDMTSTTLMANDPIIGQGLWTIVSGFGNVADPNAASTLITDLESGEEVILIWTITNGVCAESKDTLKIQSDHLPTIADAGVGAIACSDVPYVLQGNTPIYGEGLWTIVNGNATLVDSLSPVTSITDLQAGTLVTLAWTISSGTCPPSSDEVTIQVNQSPTAADAGMDQEFCEDTVAMLDANAPMIGNGQWEIISGSGVVVSVTDTASMVTGLLPGLPLVLQWVTLNEGCESRDTVIIATYDVPTQANAGDDQIICSDTTVLSGNLPLIGVGTWTLVSGMGTISDTSNPSSTITGLTPGTSVVLQWSVSNGACSKSVDEVTITISAEALVAVAGDDQHLCDTSATTMLALPATIGTGTWTVLSGSAIIEDSLDEQTVVSGLLPGSTTILRWTVSANSCPPAFDDIVITIDALPLPAEAGPDDMICDTVYMLSAVAPAIGAGEWAIISGVGILEDSLDPFSLVTDLSVGASISLEWKVSNGICPSVSDTVIILSASPADIPVASDDQMLCNASHTVLKGNNPDPGMGTGIWALVSGEGIIEDKYDSITQVTGLAIGVNIFTWTISNGICPSLSDTVIVVNNDGVELKANFLVSEFACTGDSVYMFDISDNEVPPTGYFWDFGDNTTSTERDPVHVYTQPGDYTITFTTILEGCGTASITKVIHIFECLIDPPVNPPLRNVIFAKVYPNPSDEDFQVSIKLREEHEVEITLFDAVGRLVSNRTIEDEKDILSIFSVDIAGTYFFQIRVGYEVMIFKVVKVD